MAKKVYTGVPGSFAEKNSRVYSTPVGNNYEFEIHWYNYPPDEIFIGQPEMYAESYTASIEGTKEIQKEIRDRKFIMRRKQTKIQEHRFPFNSIGVAKGDVSSEDSEDKERSIKQSALRFFNEDTQNKIQQMILELGEELKNKLG
jgi:hypothetical protein